MKQVIDMYTSNEEVAQPACYLHPWYELYTFVSDYLVSLCQLNVYF